MVINPLDANPTKWPNTLKQFVGNLHFVNLAFKGLTCACGCVSILNIVLTKMDFSSPNAPALDSSLFVICFTLAFGSTSFERKTTKYFVSGFYQSFFPPVKRVHSFDISYFKV